jgi:hypothetical protein
MRGYVIASRPLLTIDLTTSISIDTARGRRFHEMVGPCVPTQTERTTRLRRGGRTAFLECCLGIVSVTGAWPRSGRHRQ